jgi:hypothetical protein
MSLVVVPIAAHGASVEKAVVTDVTLPRAAEPFDAGVGASLPFSSE